MALNYRYFLFYRHFPKGGKLRNMGEITLCRKNCHFQHKMTYLEKTTCQIEPNFFTQVDFKVIQKRFAVITEILIFRDFRGSKSKILSKWRISHYARTDKLLGAPLGILSSWVSPPLGKTYKYQFLANHFPPKVIKNVNPPRKVKSFCRECLFIPKTCVREVSYSLFK